jgi:peptidoglycan hydrolase-like protein with peptidoglycan-binding domain
MGRARIMARVGRPPVIVGAALVAVTAGIVGNALFLQPDRHPSPLFATHPGGFAEPADRELVQAIQASLQETGYYAGPVDGLLGPQTQAAISEFERRSGRRPTGRPSDDLLAAIRSAWLAPSQPAAPESERAAARAADIAAIQDALAKAAYGPLQADGVLGRHTREAIMRFQKDHGLRVRG